jgi:hypothetical protein
VRDYSLQLLCFDRVLTWPLDQPRHATKIFIHPVDSNSPPMSSQYRISNPARLVLHPIFLPRPELPRPALTYCETTHPTLVASKSPIALRIIAPSPMLGPSNLQLQLAPPVLPQAGPGPTSQPVIHSPSSSSRGRTALSKGAIHSHGLQDAFSVFGHSNSLRI